MGSFPLVKRATLSAIQPEEDVTILYLDGFNNPGFSGGPVVFYPPGSNMLHVAGVISGYRIDPLEVVDEERPDWRAVVEANSGIIVAHGIGHATEAIDAHRGSRPGSDAGSDHTAQL
jgi:hypothetical protein